MLDVTKLQIGDEFIEQGQLWHVVGFKQWILGILPDVLLVPMRESGAVDVAKCEQAPALYCLARFDCEQP